MTKNIIEWLLACLNVAALLFLCFAIPYLIRRGWLEGENSTVRRKKVCDVCFRDLQKVRDRMNKVPFDPE